MMSPEDIRPDFDAKVRFSRLVEECLAQPGVPEAPRLLARVRARVAIERLRRRRRAQVARTLLLGVPLAALLGVGGTLWVVRGRAGLERALAAGPLADALRACTLALARPVNGLIVLDPVGVVTLMALAVAVLAYLLRDLFTDPFRGLIPSGYRRR
ncbi:MAG TPA: hypothetical protein VMS93_04255 [Candidatus Saccharimonadales bacterium]|nr:hypothetical protein [Candidatus Saccharimonadales bacterium]